MARNPTDYNAFRWVPGQMDVEQLETYDPGDPIYYTQDPFEEMSQQIAEEARRRREAPTVVIPGNEELRATAEGLGLSLTNTSFRELRERLLSTYGYYGQRRARTEPRYYDSDEILERYRPDGVTLEEYRAALRWVESSRRERPPETAQFEYMDRVRSANSIMSMQLNNNNISVPRQVVVLDENDFIASCSPVSGIDDMLVDRLRADMAKRLDFFRDANDRDGYKDPKPDGMHF